MTETPDGLLVRLERSATRRETPCGEGGMVWRSWGKAAAPPLVLFHGGSGSWRHWVRNIEALAEHRRVICPDLPGLGDSAMPAPAETPAPIAAEVHAGLRQVLAPGTQCDLVGFSYGALLAGHVCAVADEKVRSVTLVGAGALGLPRPATELQTVRDKQGEARMAAHRHNLATLMFADARGIDALALLVQDRNTQLARFRSRGFAGGGSLREAIARARVPVALLYGERDAIAWPQVEARFVALRAVQPEAWTGVIPGAGHWVAYEAAHAFNAMLTDLLRRRFPG